MTFVLGLVTTAACFGLGVFSLFRIGHLVDTRFEGRRALREVWYQGAALVAAIVLLLLNRLMHPGFASVTNLGDSAAPAPGMEWLGVPSSTPWSEIGPTLVVIPLTATIAVTYFQIIRKRSVNWKLLPKALSLSLVFSLFNSLTEEIIFRLIPVEGLSALLPPAVVALICAAGFGIPHYFGNPGKLIGVAMAGFLGWIAALSVLQTGGLAWAWGIHFAQDVPIIAFLFLQSWQSQPGKPVPAT